jgi:iron complex outermembrane recepter protein
VIWVRNSLIAIGVAVLAAPVCWGQSSGPQVDDLKLLSLEELTQVSVTSVSRRPEAVGQAPASVFVIQSTDIRALGAYTLPEALRYAPNLQVARDSTSAYSATARGFGSFETANKLLVLIDGRSVYSPLFSGVFWDEEPVFLEDVERIEVVSGPGGALWGANAVNGVINVVSRDAFDTQGMLVRGEYGDRESLAAVRYGGRFGEEAAYRVYARGFAKDALSSSPTDGDFDGASAGFRTDFGSESSRWAIHGDIFEHNVGATEVSGGNAVGRWTRQTEAGGRVELQAYYDRVERNGPAVDTVENAYDVSVEHALRPLGRHQIVWGAGYRGYDDRYEFQGLFTLSPVSESSSLWSAFVQDTVTLSENLLLTAGVKFEDSSYSGFEYMPSARLSWLPDDRSLVWAAVSRAVRTPSRLDRDLVAPGIFGGGPNFKSEELTAYEAGYRTRVTAAVSGSITVFLHDYDDLRTTTLTPGGPSPAEFLNGYEGRTYGVEAWGDFQPLPWLRLSAGFTAFNKDYKLKPGFNDIANPPSTGADPDYEATLVSRFTLGENGDASLALRHVDALDEEPVPSYTELDARLAWRILPNVELSLTGRNLLDESHPETNADNVVLENRRSILAGLRWSS